MPTKVYRISVHGCDDSSIFNIKLTEEEARVVKLVADKCTETSTYPCMPRMEIEELQKGS